MYRNRTGRHISPGRIAAGSAAHRSSTYRTLLLAQWCLPDGIGAPLGL
jgi:hypothetical protein